MFHQLLNPRMATIFMVSLTIPFLAHALDASQTASYQPVQGKGKVSGQDARAISGVGSDLAQGNTRGATNKAVNAGERKATTALTDTGKVSGQDARAISGVGSDLAQGNTRGATNKAVNAGGRKLSEATGLPSGISRSLVGGITGNLGSGRGGRQSSPSFKQKNDYVAASDEGIIRYSSDGRLSSALKNSGFGDTSRFSLGLDGKIRDASGKVTARKDPSTGKLYDTDGKEISDKSHLGYRIQSDIGAGSATGGAGASNASANQTSTRTATPANQDYIYAENYLRDVTGRPIASVDNGKLYDYQTQQLISPGDPRYAALKNALDKSKISNASSSVAASSIPSGFNNSNWDAATREKEWAKLTAKDQAGWLQEEAYKRNSANNALANQTSTRTATPANQDYIYAENYLRDVAGRPIASVYNGKLYDYQTQQLISPSDPRYAALKNVLDNSKVSAANEKLRQSPINGG